MASSQSKIKREVENKLVKLLKVKKGEEKPEKEELQIVSLAIKFLAVSAKLEESDYGADLKSLNEEGGEELEPEIDP